MHIRVLIKSSHPMYFQFTHYIKQHNMFAYLSVKATLLRHITKTFLYPHTFQHPCTPYRPKYNYTNYKSHTSNNLLFSNRKRDPTNAYNRNALHTSTHIHALPDINQIIRNVNYKSFNLNGIRFEWCKHVVHPTGLVSNTRARRLALTACCD
jgi:hypothetical protein